MPIVKLDKYTIDQIAAGEVIESPLSVVKELFENSIDAKAKNITVEIKNGGKTYIRVTDDGVGIESNQLKLAFDKHTTSKIVDFKDLYSIYSLGFRGEALASIVSVSEVTAISKTKEEKIGQKILLNGKKISQSPIATNTGTSIEVRDIFKNLPVRKKFLKSDLSETNAISKLMYSLALGYDDVSIKYIKDGRLEFQTRANENLDLRITNLLDDKLKDNLINIKNSNTIYQIHGYISDANYYRGTRALQYIFVNKRLITSNFIINMVENEYKSLIPNGRYPALFLYIQTNPKNIDINVHPNKREIKFVYEDELSDLLAETITSALKINANPAILKAPEIKDNSLLDLSDYEKLLDKYKSFSKVSEDQASYENNDFFDVSNKIENKKQNINNIDEDFLDNNKINENESFIEKKLSYRYLTSIFNRYSIFLASDNKVLILDHRRADEALKYDYFLKNFNKENIDSQILLDPIIVNLKASDRIKYKNKKDLLLKLGFEIDDFANDTIIIRSIPQIFESPESDQFFYDLLDIDIDNKKEILFDQINKIIKSNSFRKGHSIGALEANELLDKLFSLKNPHKTQQGKKTMLILTNEELEKYFDK